MNGKILEFYREGTDDDGRTLNEILAWPDAKLEAIHDFIQWLFPLPERSGANPDAPILDAPTIAAFHQSPELQERLRQSFLRMLRFYGLEFHAGKVHPEANFAACSSNWLTPNNHNHLRLTRMLRSLHLLRLDPEAQALFLALSQIYKSQPGRITPRSYQFWKDAVEVAD
jgi:hypothetical protein